jgi:transcriptional regulator with XRE-family HTH domain
MSFATLLRQERRARRLSLRQMAKMVGVSPTYVSAIERGKFPPPAEDKVKAIASILECDPDELLALAGRVASDLIEIIKRHPIETAALLRAAQGLPAEQIERFAKAAKKARGNPGGGTIAPGGAGKEQSEGALGTPLEAPP